MKTNQSGGPSYEANICLEVFDILPETSDIILEFVKCAGNLFKVLFKHISDSILHRIPQQDWYASQFDYEIKLHMVK